jgi:hypothetical protein
VTPAPIQMLWIGPRFSTLERLSVASFLANGHPVHLYAYGPIEGVPAGTTLLDARAVYPESAIYTYPEGWGKGSPAAFANQFRYRLLFEHGGAWSDTDMVCLRPFTFLDELPIATASQRMPPANGQPGEVRCNPCFINAPKGHPALGECLERCLAHDPAALKWGATGPDLVTEAFVNRGLASSVLLPDVLCPVDFWRVTELCTRPFLPHAMSHAVHLWNEMWRFARLDKDGSYPPGSGFETLKRRYLR